MTSKGMIISRIMPVLAVAAVIIFPTLFPAGDGNNLVPLLPKAEAAIIEIDITTDTTWGDKTILPGTIYNIAAGATLTISGKVSNNGEINVYGTIDVSGSSGQLVVSKQGKEQGTVNIHSGGTLNIDAYLRVDGLVDVNPGGTLKGGSDISGTLNIDGKLENGDRGVSIFSGGVVRVNDGGIFDNSDDILIRGTHSTSTMAANSTITTVSSSTLAVHSKSLLAAHLIITMDSFTSNNVAVRSH